MNQCLTIMPNGPQNPGIPAKSRYYAASARQLPVNQLQGTLPEANIAPENGPGPKTKVGYNGQLSFPNHLPLSSCDLWHR